MKPYLFGTLSAGAVMLAMLKQAILLIMDMWLCNIDRRLLHMGWHRNGDNKDNDNDTTTRLRLMQLMLLAQRLEFAKIQNRLGRRVPSRKSAFKLAPVVFHAVDFGHSLHGFGSTVDCCECILLLGAGENPHCHE